MKLVLSFFILLNLILGIIFLKIKIYANNLDLELIRKNLRKANYEVEVGLFLGGFIKVANIKIRNGFIEFLFFKKSLIEIKNSNIYIQKIKPQIDKISRKQMMEGINKTNIKLDNLDLNLEIGTDNVVITSILVGILSGIISSSMQMYVEKFSKEKYRWKILPNFEEKVLINFNANLSLSFSPILNKIVKNA